MGLKIAISQRGPKPGTKHYNVGKDNPMYGTPSPPKKKKHWNVGIDHPMFGTDRSGSKAPNFGMRWKRDKPSWNKGKHYSSKNGKDKHKQAVKAELKKLRTQFRVVDLTKILPDAIAIDFKNQRIYAVEVETGAMMSRKLTKYVDCHDYDDIVWIKKEREKCA